jgi:hypothetical protein
MSLTKLSLGGNYDVIYKSFPARESFVSNIPAGDWNIEKLFYGVPESFLLFLARLQGIVNFSPLNIDFCTSNCMGQMLKIFLDFSSVKRVSDSFWVIVLPTTVFFRLNQ